MAMKRARLTAAGIAAGITAASIAAGIAGTRAPLAPLSPIYSPLCVYDSKTGLICDATPGQTITLTTPITTQTATGQLARRAAIWPAPAVTPPAIITLTGNTGSATYTVPLVAAWRPRPGAPITITASAAPTSALAIHYTRAPTITAHHIPITLPGQITLTTWRTSTLIIETHAGLITRHYARIHTIILPIVKRNSP